jgi:hypothetical protein
MKAIINVVKASSAVINIGWRRNGENQLGGYGGVMASGQ